MFRISGLAALIMLSATPAVAPAAHADGFVECQFSVAKPFVYSIEGVDYMGSRVDVSDCRTDLPSAPLDFQMHLTSSGSPIEVAGPEHTMSYSETREVHNGDSFSVSFPNDDRLMPLYPGVYGAKVTVRSDLPWYLSDQDPQFADYQCSTWDFHGMTCSPADRI